MGCKLNIILIKICSEEYESNEYKFKEYKFERHKSHYSSESVENYFSIKLKVNLFEIIYYSGVFLCKINFKLKKGCTIHKIK